LGLGLQGCYVRAVKNGRDDAALWLRQADDDYRFGRSALAGRFHAQACFIAQQVAEKAVKSVHYGLSGRPVLGHSVHALLESLESRADVPDDLLTLGGQLDQYYVSTRYPDALPGIVPADAFSAAQARSALQAAGKILRWARTQSRSRK
jgi:HEPN domain-containing protein